MNRMLISAAHKSSGKTMVSIGLCAALKARDHAVQPFKKVLPSVSIIHLNFFLQFFSDSVDR